MANNIEFSEIEDFLQGRDDQKYITNIEAPYNKNVAYLIINDPETGKRIEEHKYKPFIWFNDEVKPLLYGGNRTEIRREMKRWGVTIKGLIFDRADGVENVRLTNSYKFKATCTGSYNNLLNFFKYGGLDVFSTEHRNKFVKVAPHEQFLISTSKRLFKGYERYDEIHRLQFDLETKGLDGKKVGIFQIGIRDNRGLEEIIEISGDTEKELRDCEKKAIQVFFNIINEIKPDVITAYNSENFDWRFIEDRCDYLFMDLKNIVKTLNENESYKTNDRARLKLGGESEPFTQTLMWGYTILDISHAVRKAKAINSNIKKWNLKYITKFSEIEKGNRVYVPGNEIHTTWADKTYQYAFNNENGEYFKYDTSKPRVVKKFEEGNYNLVSGAYIVQRYLKDDLWETEKVDTTYNEAEFLVAKIIPTSFTRCATMGTAGKWNLIMLAWSFEKGLAIPQLGTKESFTGGLSRLLQVGFAKNVAKLDYAALYPNIQITHDVFPTFDLSGVMSGLLLYIADTRDKYKFLKNDNGVLATEYKEKIKIAKENGENGETIKDLEEKYATYSKLKSDYDKKQLPLKILANSFFGSFGAPYIFYWGDIDKAEEITCRGRQYLRLLVKHFYEKYNFEPLVGDTDGFNFAIPDSVNEIRYLVKGTHRLTEKNKNKSLVGLEAVVADFNEEYMIGRMGLDIDEVCESTINFARKNYGNLINGKVKLVGASIKSDKLPIYIEEFIDKGLTMLLHDKGKEFLDLYYDTINRIYNYQIPLIKIASKSKVKQSIKEYKAHIKKTGKGGRPLPRQAHMELAIKDGINVEQGQTLYYINTGETKSHGDIKTVKDEDGNITINFGAELLNPELLESDDTFSDRYNVAKYIAAFNKKVEPLLVCFNPEIRDRIEIIKTGKFKGQTKIVNNILIDLVNIKVDDENNPKKKKTIKVLEDRKYFTKEQCKLSSGNPYNVENQDEYYENLMKMSFSEIEFWIRSNKLPNNMDSEEWIKVQEQYHEEKIELKRVGLIEEIKNLDNLLKKMELVDYTNIVENQIFPTLINSLIYCDVIDDKVVIKSKKWGEILGNFELLTKYYHDAKERDEFYRTLDVNVKDKYKEWEEYKKVLE